MNGIDFLADTNFLIHVNQGNPIVEPFLDYSFAISFITELELLGASNISKFQKQNLGRLVNDCIIIDINADIKQKCIDLRNNYKIKIPDAIIASSAIVYELPLISSDRDFEKIKELNLIYIQK